jgi:hypothetical protein
LGTTINWQALINRGTHLIIAINNISHGQEGESRSQQGQGQYQSGASQQK